MIKSTVSQLNRKKAAHQAEMQRLWKKARNFQYFFMMPLPAYVFGGFALVDYLFPHLFK